MSSRMHLMQMLIHTVSTHTLLGWADPNEQQSEGLHDFAYWQNLARTLERGRFDGVFFADSPATHAVYQDSVNASVQYGASWPNHDPMPVVAVMAAATKNLGIGVTLSTTGTTPYLATRRLSTLNYLSNGRVGWNIVTGFSMAEHMANGVGSQMPHDERYDFADEFMEICYRLWDSVPPEAILKNAATGQFADVSKVKPVDFKGRVIYYVGPVDPVRDEVVGPAGPTTATRMDSFSDMMLDLGLLASVGKSERGPAATQSIANHKSAYLMAVGGAAYLVARAIKAAKVVGFADLGMEAIYEFTVEDMPVTVAVDSEGKNVHQLAPLVWKDKIAKEHLLG